MSSLYLSLQTLMEEYKDSPYMLSRLETHLNQLLPETLKAEERKYNERKERKQRLTDEHTLFIEKFMLKHRYYYCSNNELFLEYAGKHFIGCSIDDILHKILSTISSEKKLIPWKYRTNNDLILKIKQKSPLHDIPESATIQSAIAHFYPAIFSSRSEAKYFLTIIGDCISGKKRGDIIYIISPYMKNIIQEIAYQYSEHFGLGNITQCFKYKFYDHDYKLCRLVPMKHKDYELPIPVSLDMAKHMIDILCVSAHYSTRYHNADTFLEQCSETSMVEYVKSICVSTPEKMVDAFMSNSLHAGLNISITTKNMIFLWKKYLEEREIPSIIFHEQLKHILKEKLTYDESSDSFLNVTSQYLPIVSSFMDFWETTISVVHHGDGLPEENNQENNQENKYYEYKADEVATLFHIWLNKSGGELNDLMVIELLKHFYSEIIIEENKFVKHITCSLWDKNEAVLEALKLYKGICNIPSSTNVFSLYSAYEHYTSRAKHPYIVSKRYFEIVARDSLGNMIDEYGIISVDWTNS